MRLQGRHFPGGRAESRDEFAKRFSRTARALPASFIDKPIDDMAAWCKKLYEGSSKKLVKRKGNHFEHCKSPSSSQHPGFVSRRLHRLTPLR